MQSPMPAHPVSRLVRFTPTVGTSAIFGHLVYRRPTVHPVRMVDAVELLACHVFNLADRDGQSVYMEMWAPCSTGCVSTHLAAVSCVW